VRGHVFKEDSQHFAQTSKEDIVNLSLTKLDSELNDKGQDTSA
jgi:hypothetical protein